MFFILRPYSFQMDYYMFGVPATILNVIAIPVAVTNIHGLPLLSTADLVKQFLVLAGIKQLQIKFFCFVRMIPYMNVNFFQQLRMYPFG